MEDYWNIRSDSYVLGVTDLRDEEESVWRRCLSGRVEALRSALDVGTGAGFLSIILEGLGLEVTGIDLSRGMISHGTRISRMKGADISFLQGDAEQLPFRPRSFDLVASRHLLWTLPDPAGALEEWLRVLRPGGRMLAIDGTWFDPAPSRRIRRWVASLVSSSNPVEFQRFYGEIEGDLPLFRTASPQRYVELFEEAGLARVSLDRLEEVNRFYRGHASLSYRLANSDASFMVIGER